MFKLAAIVSLMIIATWSQADSRRYKKDASETRDFHTGSAASLSCDSCGSECTSACGTRHFRSCCFNYLRRKREPDAANELSPNAHEKSQEYQPRARKYPIFVVENTADQWLSNLAPEYRPYEEVYDNALFDV